MSTTSLLNNGLKIYKKHWRYVKYISKVNGKLIFDDNDPVPEFNTFNDNWEIYDETHNYSKSKILKELKKYANEDAYVKILLNRWSQLINENNP